MKKAASRFKLFFPNAVFPPSSQGGAEADQAVAVDMVALAIKGKQQIKRYPQNLRGLLTLPSPARLLWLTLTAT